MRFTLVLALELHIHLLLGCCFYATLVLSVEQRRETFNYHKIYDECVAEQTPEQRRSSVFFFSFLLLWTLSSRLTCKGFGKCGRKSDLAQD